jgi:hypothetical protein
MARRLAAAYVLRQLDPGGRWHIVDTHRPENYPGVEALAAMESSAAQREAYVERHADPDAHILFLAVTGADLAAHGVSLP